jgi:hypothetical protein
MDDYIDDIDKINVVERLIRREQAIRDRQNPFVNYSEDEFIDRYRLNKECVLSEASAMDTRLMIRETVLS